MNHPGSVCPNCGRRCAWDQIFEESAHTWQCRVCLGWSYAGLVSKPPELLYDSGYFNDGEYAGYDLAGKSHVANFRRKMESITRVTHLAPENIRLLEVGSATGVFLSVARESGVSASTGIEVSAYCRGIAASRGIPLHDPSDPSLSDRIARLRPNLIVAWDVWEHLPAPASTIDQYLALADRHVVVAFTTVDAGSLVARLRKRRWRQYHPPTHLHYPTRRSLQYYLHDRAFSIRTHRAFGYYRPLAEYLRAIGAAVRPSPSSRALTLPVYLNLFDIQLVVAEKGREHG